MISTTETTSILLVSDDLELCAAARRQFENNHAASCIAAVRSVDAARRIVEHTPPAVILLEESSLFLESNTLAGRLPELNSVVSTLAVHAPVVVIGDAAQQTELAPLVAAGAADFVERSGGCLERAVECVEHRLRRSQHLAQNAQEVGSPGSASSGAFGEILRHELNNPLTGILGNAELLLAEVRRKNDGMLPPGGMQRLETIAALAVRLREAVRRLSQESETRDRVAR